ncbi:MAG: SLC13 family permease [gamma proteobacterium symbiont of Bathyaustriella thionipta]|nr:SLC13 family permease [gamma proteobacterium symbiont of Bathyaustriella thionipta]MCU7949012.1 SLC13 family permease [gamma proteobacterium symbiont of Bathyaustriella thionipta]MCU7952212.1 SLC13 family permease [gamma proteobacterium symbiont of Bathyaustriella thionipta]MCU7955596.1 SLC13 family permease [gamma proteobacterium symbiont of Bathyaustriella thionipta]MCU7967162.1 SLC13 family permease [gamma proteobacterium symbiont of Bathyaustriella thionipta]
MRNLMKDKIKAQKKKIIAGIVFLALALFMSTLVPNIQMSWVMGLLILTIYLFAFEVVDVDVTAISIMVLLGLSTLFAPVMGLDAGLVSTDKLFNGFSSNAVMSIIAVMIIGAGLDKTGIMSKVAAFILNVGGTSEKRIIPIVSSTVGIISSFIQNVGAAALFIPVVSRISARSGLPMSRLLMPMGFCAILGGTVTMVGSSPLILLNDLILTSNHALPETQQMHTWGLFSVTPVGLALVFTGIVYFVLAGRFVLPKMSDKAEANAATNTMDYFQNIYGIDYAMYEIVVPAESPLVGYILNDVESDENIRIIAAIKGNTKDVTIGPNGVARDYTIEANTVLGVLASDKHIQDFSHDYTLEVKDSLEFFSETLSSPRSGVAEVVIPPGSQLIDKSARDVWLRKTYGLAMVALHREGETLGTGEGIRDLPFQAGDTLVVHTLWTNLDRIVKDKNFVVVTTEYPHEETRPHKVGWAGLFFAIALSMVLFTDLKLSVALLTGAIGMVLSGVLKIDEAYEAVSWKTVFLLASLIPLGLAVETSGTAGWISEQTLHVVGHMPVWVIQASIAVLATFFTLVMSNVGVTVLLVPLAVNIALGVEGADPAVFALTVAIATSNSFLIPTHQVNALIMGPAGYKVPDFMKAGGIMTLLFLVVMMIMMMLVF